KGSIYYPLAMTGNLAVDVEDLTLGDQTLADSVSADFNMTSQGWKSRLLQAALADFLLDVELTHKRAFPFSFEEAEATDNFWAGIGLHPDDEITATFKSEPVESGRGNQVVGDLLSNLPFAGETLKSAGIRGS